MELGSGFKADYVSGEVVVSGLDGGLELKFKLAALIKPFVADIEAKIESGAIDPVAGTDMDKVAMLALVEGFKKLAGI